MQFKESSELAREKTLIILDPALRRGFTSIPNAVLFAKGISMQAKCLYAALLAFAWQDDECFPGQERLAQELGCSLSTVKRHLAELRDAGLISWRQRGLNRPNIYFIHPLKDVKALGGADSLSMTCPDSSQMTCPDSSPVTYQDGSPVSYKEDSVEEYGRGGGIRARGDTNTVEPDNDGVGVPAASVPHPGVTARPALDEARATLRRLSGVDPPERVLVKAAAYDDGQILRALDVLRAYAARKEIADVEGFLLTALAEEWDIGPPAGPTDDPPRRTKRTPSKTARDKPTSYKDLYV